MQLLYTSSLQLFAINGVAPVCICVELGFSSVPHAGGMFWQGGLRRLPMVQVGESKP